MPNLSIMALTALLGILGPILCYIFVYGGTEIVKRVYLLLKALRFKKKMKKRSPDLFFILILDFI